MLTQKKQKYIDKMTFIKDNYGHAITEIAIILADSKKSPEETTMDFVDRVIPYIGVGFQQGYEAAKKEKHE